jgi:hypothetical protein
MTERPITIDQEWADGWGPRYRAAKEKVRHRLEVCEAQMAGPWDTVSDGDSGAFEIQNHLGWSIAMRYGWIHQLEGSNANGIAISAQRTERPQELRALDALLDLLDRMSTEAPETVEHAERGLRIVEKELGL